MSPTSIRDGTTLDRGEMSYQPTFELVQCDQNKGVEADILGTVKATRITANTRKTN